ncbi:hypothetical protein GN956_G17186 [Arapaima gigas]
MTRQTRRQELPAESGVTHHEEPLTPQVKNIMTHLSCQNLRLAAKNGPDSSTVGLCPSHGRGDVAGGPLSGHKDSQEHLTPRSPLTEENKPPFRPLRLAPLELPREVKEAQWEKMKAVQGEANTAARKLDFMRTEPWPQKMKPTLQDHLSHPAGWPKGRDRVAPVKAQNPSLVPMHQIQPTTALPRGSPARGGGQWMSPILPSLPPFPNPHGKTLCVRENKEATLQEASRRQWRLMRTQGLDRDQDISSTAEGGLPQEEGQSCHSGISTGLREPRALRVSGCVTDRLSRKSP